MWDRILVRHEANVSGNVTTTASTIGHWKIVLIFSLHKALTTRSLSHLMLDGNCAATAGMPLPSTYIRTTVCMYASMFHLWQHHTLDAWFLWTYVFLILMKHTQTNETVDRIESILWRQLEAFSFLTETTTSCQGEWWLNSHISFLRYDCT